MIPVPFVLQLAFQPREGLGGSEPLLDSDHAELLHPGVTNRDCCDHPGVTPVCGGSFVPSLGLEPPPFVLENSSQQQLRAELGMESPQSRSRLLPAEPPAGSCKPVWDRPPGTGSRQGSTDTGQTKATLFPARARGGGGGGTFPNLFLLGDPDALIYLFAKASPSPRSFCVPA